MTAAAKRAQGLPRDVFPHFLPLAVRCDLRLVLEGEGLPRGWRLGGNPGLMGQLLLENDEHQISMRFLKERRRTRPGGVPHAGLNRARREAWAQPLTLPLDFGTAGGVVILGRPEAKVELLLCWDHADPKEGDAFTLRIVHTIAPGTYGSAVPCDLIIDLEHGGGVFTKLIFPGSDDPQDFFPIDISEEENGV
ncbi:hypothetical protein [Mycobacteroides abscessus]